MRMALKPGSIALIMLFALFIWLLVNIYGVIGFVYAPQSFSAGACVDLVSLLTTVVLFIGWLFLSRGQVR